MKEINTEEVEATYEPMFEKLKELLIENINKEVEKHINEKSIKDFFEIMWDKDVLSFVEQDDQKKVDDFLDWFMHENWTLGKPVYDFTRDEFEFEYPNEKFELEKFGVTSRRCQFTYLIPTINNSDIQ